MRNRSLWYAAFRVNGIPSALVASVGHFAVAQVIPLENPRPCNAKTSTLWAEVEFGAQCGPLPIPAGDTAIPPTCVDLPMSPWVGCGSSLALTVSGTMDLALGVNCLGALEVGFSLGIGCSHTIQSLPCNRCTGSVCFNDARLGWRAVERSVPEWTPSLNSDPHEFGGLLASRRCGTVTGYRVERYTLLTLRPGAPMLSQRCEQADCVCEMLGQDCNCGGEGAPPATITQLYPLLSQDCFTIDLAQFRQGDPYGASIHTLDDLCVLELALLRRFADTVGIAGEAGTVLLRIVGGDDLSVPTHALAGAISMREAMLAQTGLFKDVNRDGLIDGGDLGVLIVQSARSMNAEPIDQRADLNADGLVDSLDVGVFFTVSAD